LVIYADTVWAVNTLIDFLMLMLAARLCGYCAKPMRCLCGAALGGVYAVFTLLPGFVFLASFLWQLVFFLLMTAVGYGLRKAALRPASVAFLCSIALAGFFHFLLRFVPLTSLYQRSGVIYPLGTRILLLFAGGFYLAASLMATGSMKHSRGEVFPVILSTSCGKMKVSALLDTGNSLHDPLSGKPVIVVNGITLRELFGIRVNARELLDAPGIYPNIVKRYPEHSFRLIPYRTVGVSGGMLLAGSCKIRIGKREESVFAAFSPHPVSDGGGYEVLIGGNLL